MKQTFIDVVKLMESPSASSPWYVVEGSKGTTCPHWVDELRRVCGKVPSSSSIVVSLPR
jgi:hypothetical protein